MSSDRARRRSDCTEVTPGGSLPTLLERCQGHFGTVERPGPGQGAIRAVSGERGRLSENEDGYVERRERPSTKYGKAS